MTKYLFRVGLLKFAARRFEREVNALLVQGWSLSEWQYIRVGWFRYMLYGKLTK